MKKESNSVSEQYCLTAADKLKNKFAEWHKNQPNLEKVLNIIRDILALPECCQYIVTG